MIPIDDDPGGPKPTTISGPTATTPSRAPAATDVIHGLLGERYHLGPRRPRSLYGERRQRHAQGRRRRRHPERRHRHRHGELFWRIERRQSQSDYWRLWRLSRLRTPTAASRTSPARPTTTDLYRQFRSTRSSPRGDGHDEIYGHGGNDNVHGGIGNDLLDGVEGADSSTAATATTPSSPTTTTTSRLQ